VSWIDQRDDLQSRARAFAPAARLVPIGWLRNSAIALRPFQFYPKSWTADQVLDRIPHECRHTQQQRELGLFWFLLLYLFSGARRARFEIEAEVAYWATLTGPDRDQRVGDSARALAMVLASWRYGWAVSASEAQRLCAEAAIAFIASSPTVPMRPSDRMGRS